MSKSITIEETVKEIMNILVTRKQDIENIEESIKNVVLNSSDKWENSETLNCCVNMISLDILPIAVPYIDYKFKKEHGIHIENSNTNKTGIVIKKLSERGILGENSWSENWHARKKITTYDKCIGDIKKIVTKRIIFVDEKGLILNFKIGPVSTPELFKNDFKQLTNEISEKHGKSGITSTFYRISDYKRDYVILCFHLETELFNLIMDNSELSKFRNMSPDYELFDNIVKIIQKDIARVDDYIKYIWGKIDDFGNWLHPFIEVKKLHDRSGFFVEQFYNYLKEKLLKDGIVLNNCKGDNYTISLEKTGDEDSGMFKNARVKDWAYVQSGKMSIKDSFIYVLKKALSHHLEHKESFSNCVFKLPIKNISQEFNVIYDDNWIDDTIKEFNDLNSPITGYEIFSYFNTYVGEIHFRLTVSQTVVEMALEQLKNNSV